MLAVLVLGPSPLVIICTDLTVITWFSASFAGIITALAASMDACVIAFVMLCLATIIFFVTAFCESHFSIA